MDNALAALGSMTLEEFFEAAYAYTEARRAGGAAQQKEDPIPDILTSEDVMHFYTRKSYSDLSAGLANGDYPLPFTRKGDRRRWNKKDWDEWQRKQKLKEAG